MDSQTLTGRHKVPEGQEYMTPKKQRVCIIQATQGFNILIQSCKKKAASSFLQHNKKLSATVMPQTALHQYPNFFHCTFPCQHLLVC